MDDPQVLDTATVARYVRRDCRDGGRHPAAVFEALRESVARHGVREPVLVYVDLERSRAVVGNGNHRVAAARLAGVEQVPVVVEYRELPDRYPWARPLAEGDFQGSV